MTNVLILMVGSMLGQCGTECALVSVTPHDVSVAFAGTTGLSHHRHIAPVRRTVHFFRHRQPVRSFFRNRQPVRRALRFVFRRCR